MGGNKLGRRHQNCMASPKFHHPMLNDPIACRPTGEAILQRLGSDNQRCALLLSSIAQTKMLCRKYVQSLRTQPTP